MDQYSSSRLLPAVADVGVTGNRLHHRDYNSVVSIFKGLAAHSACGFSVQSVFFNHIWISRDLRSIIIQIKMYQSKRIIFDAIIVL